MATIAHVSSAIRIAGTNGRSVCNINGVDPDMTATDAAGFGKLLITQHYHTPDYVHST